MCSYKTDPASNADQLAAFLEHVAVVGLTVGVLASLVAGAVLLQDARRFLAIASLPIMAIAFAVGSHAAFTIWMAILVLLLLVSIVQWPTRLRWVNWPLLIGGGVFTTCIIASSVVFPVPC